LLPRTRAAGWRRLPRCQPPRRGIVVEQDDRRAFLLDGVEPAAIGVEMEMPRPVPGRQRDRVRLVRGQDALPLVELPDEDPVQAQVGVQHEAPRGVGLDHVRVGPVVPLTAKLPGGAMVALAGPISPASFLMSAASPRRRRGGPAAPPPSRRNSWPPERSAPTGGRSRTSGRRRRSGRCSGASDARPPIDGKGADRALLVVAHPIGLVRGIQSGPGGVQDEAARAGPIS
jgi:hypothetical protein